MRGRLPDHLEAVKSNPRAACSHNMMGMQLTILRKLAVDLFSSFRCYNVLVRR